MDLIQCGHCGRRKKDDDNDEGINCSLCNKTHYCNENCRTLGWTNHQDECNVVTVPHVGMTLFVPYLGEDVFDDETMDRVADNACIYQKHEVRAVDPSGKIYQHTVDGNAAIVKGGADKMGRGGIMSETLQSMNYDMEIEFVDHWEPSRSKKITLSGLSVGQDSIWEGNTGLGGKLAKNNIARAAKSDRTTIVLWPSPDAIQKAGGMRIPSTGGNLKISVIIGGQTVAALWGVYTLDQSATAGTGFFKRTLRRLLPFQNEFPNKFKADSSGNSKTGVTAFLESLESLRASDRDGNNVQLIFEVPRSKGVAPDMVELLDVEFAVPRRLVERAPGLRPELPPRDIETPFHLDAADLNHITGLVMALEDKIASGELAKNAVQLETIIAHQKALEVSPDGVEPGPKVNAAVEVATQALWNIIGIRVGSFELLTKSYFLTKLRGGSKNAIQLAKNLATDMKKAREQSKGAKGRTVKGLINRSIKNLREALDEMQKKAAGYFTAESRKDFDEARNVLREIDAGSTVEDKSN
jgi:hypothetical protein